MEVALINTGFFKLDGGAMFGVVPKSIWSKTNPADENNMCSWAMRSLLIKSDDQVILVDNGMGDKQSEKFFSYYYLHGNDSLEKSIKAQGIDFGDVTDMFLTHLHFDHCGGGVVRSGDKLLPTFDHANYWTNEDHWKWATQPNAREKASFLKENLLPMEESGHLNFVNEVAPDLLPFDIIYVDGHTDKMMLPKLSYKDRTVVFMADLIPSVGHIPVPYVMGYDTRPLLTLSEKSRFLEEAVDNNYILAFQHDPVNECCTLKRTERGVRVDQVFRFDEI